jgi:glutamyl-tRNA synthetase
MPFLNEAYEDVDRTYASKVVKCLMDRMKTIRDIVPLSGYFFKDNFTVDPEAKTKYLDKPGAKELVSKLREKLSKINTFNKESLEPVFKSLADELKVKLGEIIHPTRVLLTGRAESPGIYDVIEVLGKERVISRLGNPSACISISPQ